MKRFSGILRKCVLLAAAISSANMIAPRTEASSVYAFAQQKVYNMAMTSVTGQGLTGNSLTIRTSTASTLSGFPGVSNNLPAMDALQSFSGNPAYNPGENFSGAAPYGVGNTTVLAQSVATPAGLQNATDPTIPAGVPSTGADLFTRSDVLTRVPPPTNLALNPAWLFTPGFTGGGPDANVSLDSAAEGLGNLPPGAIGSATSTWTASGSFAMSQADAVQLSFNLIDRLVAFADLAGQVADASLGFSLDIKDANNQSVFTTAPSYSRNLSSPVVAQGTRNDNKLGITNEINGITFVSPTLAAGEYTFSITGTTTINVSVVPEPSSYVMMGLGVVAMGGLRFRRKLQSQRLAAE